MNCSLTSLLTASPHLCSEHVPLGNTAIGIRHLQVSISKKEKDAAQKLRTEKEAIKMNSHVPVGARIYLRLC